MDFENKSVTSHYIWHSIFTSLDKRVNQSKIYGCVVVKYNGRGTFCIQNYRTHPVIISKQEVESSWSKLCVDIRLSIHVEMEVTVARSWDTWLRSSVDDPIRRTLIHGCLIHDLRVLTALPITDDEPTRKS